ncbi:MAG: dihydrolipoamide acetyltransferase [Coxiellaceae bacterium]|nr:dihydrolipoamide acetyltransferase [Coxiellaceae bacterium]
MASIETVLVPDIGGATDVDVIEVLVSVGDTVAVDDALVTLESDKASMEVPSPVAGTIESIAVSVGDKLSEGGLVLTVATGATSNVIVDDSSNAVKESDLSSTGVQPIIIPDIGGADAVDIIEISVTVGDSVALDDPLMTLESDKASMEVPSPLAGQIVELTVAVGDKVSEGDVIGQIKTISASPQQNKKTSSAPMPPSTSMASKPDTTRLDPTPVSQQHGLYIGPAVRRLAREFGVDISKVRGTGQKGRITKVDLQEYVKQQLQGGSKGGTGFDWPELPKIDFSKFGEVTQSPLSKIKKISGSFLHRNWVSIPHVTQFEEVDITDMEAFRQRHKVEAAQSGIKLTPIVFVMKALVASLKAYPSFNASLSPDGQSLIVKHFYNIGVAVDTPNGLVVPVLKDVDSKGALELAKELGDISLKAREKGLTPAEMQGGCMSISSLGGIGGTAFTPIINAPEVAILGLSRSYQKPVYNKNSQTFEPRLTMPVSLSYDHRVIDGAEAARFIVHFASRLADIETLIL